MKWALLSVWDKTGIIELAQVLIQAEIQHYEFLWDGKGTCKSRNTVYRSFQLYRLSRDDGRKGKNPAPKSARGFTGKTAG